MTETASGRVGAPPEAPSAPAAPVTHRARDTSSGAPLRPGDAVTWNGRDTGIVRQIIGDDADVEESRLLGRKAVWRFALSALRRTDAGAR